MKMFFSLYLGAILADFDIGVLNYQFGSNLLDRCRFSFLPWTFEKKLKFCKFKTATDAIWKIVFDYISAPYCPINAKFGMEMKNPMRI